MREGKIDLNELGQSPFLADVGPKDRNILRMFLALVGGAVGAGMLLRDRWGIEGVKPPPPVKLKSYAVELPASSPTLVVVRSNAPDTAGLGSKDEEFRAREQQAFTMVKRALDEMGGVNRFISNAHQYLPHDNFFC